MWRGGAKCLFKRRVRRHSFTSALSPSWIFTCTWRPTWKWWKATVASTDGPYLWRTTVRLLHLDEDPTKILNPWCIVLIIPSFRPPSSPRSSLPGVCGAQRPRGTTPGVLALHGPQILSTHDVHDPLLLRGAGEDDQSGTSSKTLFVKTKHVGANKTKYYRRSVWLWQVRVNFTLETLVPGEEVLVQIAAKCGLDENSGHWSSWSKPKRAVVPQGAGALGQGGH